MSSKRGNNKNKNKNINKKIEIEQKSINKSEDDECDELLKELDELEKKSNDISLKVRNLIRSDKEAIKDLNKNKDKEDLDYLDDEDYLQEDNDESHDIDESKESEELEESNESDESSDETDEIEENNKEEEKTEDCSTQEENDEQENDEIDFLAKINKEGPIISDKFLRKRQPKRLHDNTQNPKGVIPDNVKNFLFSKQKNFYVGVSIIVLFVILFVSLIFDIDNKNEESSIDGEFITMDTTPFVTLINDYYTTLRQEDIAKAKTFLENSDNISDDEIREESAQYQAYHELINDSFKINNCYVQKGLEDNEYIVYVKFQVNIKSIETPAPGAFIVYFIGNTDKDGNVTYKISNGIQDKSSKRYKYITKMKNCSNVKEIFDQVEKELDEACAKDENLKLIVDKLNGTQETTEPTESTTASSDETTQPQETTAAPAQTTAPAAN